MNYPEALSFSINSKRLSTEQNPVSTSISKTFDPGNYFNCFNRIISRGRIMCLDCYNLGKLAFLIIYAKLYVLARFFQYRKCVFTF